MASLRTLLILGRVSNLPTVWSNCLAGWILGGGGEAQRFFWLGAGATCLYTGGMYLNDAFDVDFDRQHRRERPIPSGAISLRAVWLWGLGWLVAGGVLLVPLGKSTALYTALLIATILLYDAIHKLVALSPLMMAGCRFFLYLVAASAAVAGVSGLVIWSALVLASYVVGLSYMARKESTRARLQAWPALLLTAPVVLALVVNNREYRAGGLALCLLVGGWVLLALRHTLNRPDPVVSRTVSALLAGIVLVDFLAVGWRGPGLAAVFALLFVAALLFQRFIPAT